MPWTLKIISCYVSRTCLCLSYILLPNAGFFCGGFQFHFYLFVLGIYLDFKGKEEKNNVTMTAKFVNSHEITFAINGNVIQNSLIEIETNQILTKSWAFHQIFASLKIIVGSVMCMVRFHECIILSQKELRII